MQLKEKKEMDEAFKKAQKPWAKLLHKVNKCKSEYHNACKNEKSAINMERNASGDSSVSEDHVSIESWNRIQTIAVFFREHVLHISKYLAVITLSS